MSSIVFVVHGDKQPITVWAHGTKSILGVNGLKRVEKESQTFTFLALKVWPPFYLTLRGGDWNLVTETAKQTSPAIRVVRRFQDKNRWLPCAGSNNQAAIYN